MTGSVTVISQFLIWWWRVMNIWIICWDTSPNAK